MSRSSQDIDLFQGDDLRVICTVRDQSGALVDISEAQSIRYAVARGVNAVPVIEKSLNNGIELANSSAFFFDLDSAETLPLSGGYYHEAEVVTDQGLTYTTLSGSIRFRSALIEAGT